MICFDQPRAPGVVEVKRGRIFRVANGSIFGVSNSAAPPSLVLAIISTEAARAGAAIAPGHPQSCAVASIETWTGAARVVKAIAQRLHGARRALTRRPICGCVDNAGSAVFTPQGGARVHKNDNTSVRSEAVSAVARPTDTHRVAVGILNALGVLVADTAIGTLLIGAYGARRACFSVSIVTKRAIAASRRTLQGTKLLLMLSKLQFGLLNSPSS